MCSFSPGKILTDFNKHGTVDPIIKKKTIYNPQTTPRHSSIIGRPTGKLEWTYKHITVS